MLVKISQKIKEGQILVSDGAWGTFLHQKGLQSGECPESWNIAHSEAVLGIARSYIEAGANMIETNSFGGSIFKLKAYGLAGQVHAFNKAAAEISREAAGPDKHVLGSIGPTGKIIMMGDVTADELYRAFQDQAMALEAGGADTLIVETMSDLEEAEAAVSACLNHTRCEVILTMTFEKSGENEYHTMMGVTPEQMVSKFDKYSLAALGTNCGNGMRDMVGIVRAIRRIDQHIPILVHANAGAPEYRDGATVFPETASETASHVESLIKAGAGIIGGCCGTTPTHIKAIADVVKVFSSL